MGKKNPGESKIENIQLDSFFVVVVVGSHTRNGSQTAVMV